MTWQKNDNFICDNKRYEEDDDDDVIIKHLNGAQAVEAVHAVQLEIGSINCRK